MNSNILAHNLSAMNAKRQLGLNNKSKATAMERLSSGYKINRAADDASGLAMSEKMRRQIRGLDQGARNIQEGISYCKIADGALNEISDITNRMEELAVKAANSTNSDSDRAAINEEIQQLKAETERILSTTKYNEIYIWKGGSPKTNTVPSGTTMVNAINYELKTFGTNMGMEHTNLNAAAYPVDNKIYIETDTTQGIRFYWTGYNGIEYKSNWKNWPADETASIPDPNNPNRTITVTHPGAMNTTVAELMDYSLYPDAVGINGILKYSTNEYTTQADLITSLNGCYFDVNIDYEHESIIYNQNGISKIEDNSDTDPVLVDCSTDVQLTYPALVKSECDFDGKADTSFARAKPSNANNFINKPTISNGQYSGTCKFQFEFDNIGTVTATTNDTIPNTFTAGSLIHLNFNLTSNTSFTIGSNSTQYTDVGTLRVSILPQSGDTFNDIMNKLVGIGGIDIYYSNYYKNNSDNGKGGKNYVSSVIHAQTPKIEIPQYSTEEILDTTTERTIPIHTASESTENVRINITYPILNLSILGLSDTNVLTVDDALQALDDIQYAHETINDERALFGAYQNRLEHAYNGTLNTVENTTAAESRIRDSDMAELIRWYSLTQILTNAGESLLAQATKNPETVLKLLQ